ASGERHAVRGLREVDEDTEEAAVTLREGRQRVRPEVDADGQRGAAEVEAAEHGADVDRRDDPTELAGDDADDRGEQADDLVVILEHQLTVEDLRVPQGELEVTARVDRDDVVLDGQVEADLDVRLEGEEA